MIKLTVQNTANAVIKSKALRPNVKYIADRTFDVHSSRNKNIYRVELAVINGEKFATCNCKASEKSLVCYHITSAIAVNFYRQTIKQQIVAEVFTPKGSTFKNGREYRGGTKI